jgi:hypothetical protein
MTPGVKRSEPYGVFDVSPYDVVNDPNAGSPTITLLRLLLPLGRAVIRTLVLQPTREGRETGPPNS